MNRRLSKANSITTYDTATLWRALEASSANHQNPTTRRWQRAASRLLRQHTITLIPNQTDHLLASSSGINVGSGAINLVLNSFSFFFSFYSLNQLKIFIV